MSEPIELTQGERLHPTIIKLWRELERQLAQEREANEHLQHGVEKTASIRGRIALLKELIALVKDDTPAL